MKVRVIESPSPLSMFSVISNPSMSVVVRNLSLRVVPDDSHSPVYQNSGRCTFSTRPELFGTNVESRDVDSVMDKMSQEDEVPCIN